MRLICLDELMFTAKHPNVKTPITDVHLLPRFPTKILSEYRKSRIAEGVVSHLDYSNYKNGKSDGKSDKEEIIRSSNGNSNAHYKDGLEDYSSRRSFDSKILVFLLCSF
ncbi:unnamed protein product [Angiostrongylus costaricensis]|uniref:DDE_Tnp_1_7 domain-containing protein n=1 Tax=Angiostrongylus costaricensis TaxID=334426 RepID=A0A0R3PMY0_ANGCS|nr:unnamed protein product [Angiostrongylus costaricensis]